MNPTPVDADKFEWTEIKAHGHTDFGAACEELCKKMSREAFLASKVGYKKPIVILITDGAPWGGKSGEEKDKEMWKPYLEDLKKNGWFQHSLKFAIAVHEAKRDILEDFVGSPEGVYDIADADLSKMIQIIAIKSAEIGTQTMTFGSSEKTNGMNLDEKEQRQINEAIKIDMQEWV